MLPQGFDAPMPLGFDAGSKATEQSHVEPQIAGIRGRHDAEMRSSAKEKNKGKPTQWKTKDDPMNGFRARVVRNTHKHRIYKYTYIVI